MDPAKLLIELNELEQFLEDNTHKNEREEIAPFFKPRTQLCAALGYANAAIEAPDLCASELSLFGDFIVDAASGDSQANAFTLIEFEDAGPQSIFGDLNPAIHLVLIAGRDADLRPEDFARLRWRAQNMTLGQYRISCFTFDGILASLKRRLTVANASVIDGRLA